MRKAAFLASYLALLAACSGTYSTEHDVPGDDSNHEPGESNDSNDSSSTKEPTDGGVTPPSRGPNTQADSGPDSATPDSGGQMCTGMRCTNGNCTCTRGPNAGKSCNGSSGGADSCSVVCAYPCGDGS